MEPIYGGADHHDASGGGGSRVLGVESHPQIPQVIEVSTTCSCGYNHDVDPPHYTGDPFPNPGGQGTIPLTEQVVRDLEAGHLQEVGNPQGIQEWVERGNFSFDL